MHEPADVIPLRAAPEGVEVRHLRAFVAVADELNFSRAAERLYVSQPALSRQIRALERVVGCELLRRSTHHVALTLAGQALLDRARAVLAALDEAVAAAQSVGGELSARIMGLWAPVLAVATNQASVEAVREVFESFLAKMPMPPEVEVRPVTAGGVPRSRSATTRRSSTSTAAATSSAPRTAIGRSPARSSPRPRRVRSSRTSGSRRSTRFLPRSTTRSRPTAGWPRAAQSRLGSCWPRTRRAPARPSDPAQAQGRRRADARGRCAAVSEH